MAFAARHEQQGDCESDESEPRHGEGFPTLVMIKARALSLDDYSEKYHDAIVFVARSSLPFAGVAIRHRCLCNSENFDGRATIMNSDRHCRDNPNPYFFFLVFCEEVGRA